MNRYFKIKCDEHGEPSEESIVEIYPPYGVAFSLGILIGITITIIIL